MLVMFTAWIVRLGRDVSTDPVDLPASKSTLRASVVSTIQREDPNRTFTLADISNLRVVPLT